MYECIYFFFFFFYSCNKLFCFEILQSHREANMLGIKPSQVFEVSLWESRQRADDSLNLSCGAETALEKTSITVDLFWWHFRGLAEPEKQRLCDMCLVNPDSVQISADSSLLETRRLMVLPLNSGIALSLAGQEFGVCG